MLFHLLFTDYHQNFQLNCKAQYKFGPKIYIQKQIHQRSKQFLDNKKQVNYCYALTHISLIF